jgi:crossover junction endodeoxyribonuclease RusA
VRKVWRGETGCNEKQEAMNDPIIFLVDGKPRAKQSFRYTENGGGFTDPGVKAWQDTVSTKARQEMFGRDPITGPVAVRLVFVLKTKRKIDIDNLSKGVLDSLKDIVFGDDSDVVNLHAVKHIMPKATPGVYIEVHAGQFLPGFEVQP